MGKKIVLIVMFALSLSFLTACSETEKEKVVEKESLENRATGDKHMDSQMENPFDLEAMESSGQNVQAAYGYTITNMDIEKRVIENSGEEIEVAFAFDNSSSECEVGMMIFVDGLAQKYYLVKDSKKFSNEDFVIPIKLKEKDRTETTIKFKPLVGKEGDDHQVFFTCMYEPSYAASEKSQGYGNYHKTLPMLLWKLKGSFANTYETISTDVSYQVMSEAFQQPYIRENRDGTVRNQLETSLKYKFIQEGEEAVNRIRVKDGKAEFHVQFFGGKEESYRISAFLNHELVPVFAGSSYVDFSIKKDQIATLDMKLLTEGKNLSDYNSFYLYIVPISTDEFANDVLINKTNTIIILK